MSTDQPSGQPSKPDPMGAIGGMTAPQRVKLGDLLRQMREIEIDHEGKIYRLRLTQANKLILTA